LALRHTHPDTAQDRAGELARMGMLLSISRGIDWLNRAIGKIVLWVVLAAVLVSAVNAVVRYGLNMSSNAWLELQWYFFGAIFMLCAGYTLLHNEHIRIDVVSSRLSPKTRNWIEIVGGVFFLLPLAIGMAWLSWPVFINAIESGEMSGNAGGLIRWPARLLIPIGFLLLSLQGISELIKRVAVMQGLIPDPYEKKDAVLPIKPVSE
jgi:TRAP-type mannitol/chloroaromatic compound transport system permease small subunit